MPIVTVEIVGGEEVACVASALATRLGEALAAPAGSVWVQVRSVPSCAYAENGPEQPPPVFVRVLARGDASAQRAGAIAAAVAQIVGRPLERVHVICEPDANGRVFFGGAPDPR